MKKFLFLILAGALVFATFGCKQATDSEPEPVPDTWTEITDITGYEGKFSGSTEMTGWQFAEPWAESFGLTKEAVEGVVVPLDMTVGYPIEEKVYYSMTVSLKAFFEHTAGLSDSTLEEAWEGFKSGVGEYFTYDDANYKATVTQTASASEFNGWISGEGAVMRISVNQDQSKVKYEGLAEEEAGWVVTVILNKQ